MYGLLWVYSPVISPTREFHRLGPRVHFNGFDIVGAAVDRSVGPKNTAVDDIRFTLLRGAFGRSAGHQLRKDQARGFPGTVMQGDWG
jgi:hypothetical protein